MVTSQSPVLLQEWSECTSALTLEHLAKSVAFWSCAIGCCQYQPTQLHSQHPGEVSQRCLRAWIPPLSLGFCTVHARPASVRFWHPAAEILSAVRTASSTGHAMYGSPLGYKSTIHTIIGC
jgi:hypothetical protein